MRVLVCGGRDYKDSTAVFSALDILNATAVVTEIIQGNAAGADALAALWAKKRGVPDRRFPADWRKHGHFAGPSRNQQMLDEGRPDLVLAFPGGRGTADMVRRAEKAGVPVRTYAEREALGPSRRNHASQAQRDEINE